ncbi:MAG: hypothetical protein FJX76_19445 [Armatimonadetes bacterium]|nr:hypothetical protein [Armatimonadota bacterium]
MFTRNGILALVIVLVCLSVRADAAGWGRGSLGGRLPRLPKIKTVDPIGSPTASYLVAFRSVGKGRYLGLGLRQEAAALPEIAGQDASFMLIDRDGGPLRSGDVVGLALRENKLFLCAEDGGGREVRINRPASGEWEALTIVRVAGPGPIRSGDEVALRTRSGHYLSAVEGGGREVNARGAQIGPWERWRIEVRHRGPI